MGKGSMGMGEGRMRMRVGDQRMGKGSMRMREWMGKGDGGCSGNASMLQTRQN